MLVRVVRRLGRGLWIGAVGTAAVAVGAFAPQPLRAQDSTAANTHTVKRGDTLWDLAKTYLGDSFLWPEIYRVNVDLIEDPHWIYPGEVLRLPMEQAKVLAVAPPAPAPAPTEAKPVPEQQATQRPVEQQPTVIPVTPPPESLKVAPEEAPPPSIVRVGEYAASPWVEERGGPRGSGYIVENASLSSVATADHSRMNLYDPIMIAPPEGTTASVRQRYLAYRLGPLIENFGQIVIPTGIVEVTRANQPGEAAVARLVHMFGEVLQGQRLIPYDSSAAIVTGSPAPVTNGRMAKVRWIYNNPVLPSVQSYVVVDMSQADGVHTGDQIEFYEPRQPPVDGREIAIPEISIARAQVLRVTPFGATAVITSQIQPKIEEGTAVRVAAKMP